MSGQLVTSQDGKITKVEEEHRAIFHPDTDSASLDVVQIIKEKVLVLMFNNGTEIEKITVHNLADMRGRITKEQLIYQKIAEGRGHLMVLCNGEKRMIRISNIISAETKWLPL